MEDHELLREFAEHHSEKAFAELVAARHIDMKHFHSQSEKRLLAATGAVVVIGIIGIVPWQLVAARGQPNGTKAAAPALQDVAAIGEVTARGKTESAGNGPEVVPGTATITVRARSAEGARPVGARCGIETWSQAQPPPGTTNAPLWPTVTGADGDWVIYNVVPGRWAIMVNADGFAYTQEANAKHLEVHEADQRIDASTNNRTGNREWKPVGVRAGENVLLSFTLLRGVTLTGRVIAADTGKPIKGATVGGGAWNRCRDTTDADGRFTVKHLAPGEGVTARGNGYVAGPSRSVKVEEGQTVAVPDIVLQRGGWISGRVVRPPDAPEGVRTYGDVFPKFDGRMPEGCITSSEHLKPDGTFQVGPLPPGSYTLKAQLSTGKGLNPSGRWRGEVTGIRVEIGKETKDVVIEVSPQE